MPSEKLRRPRHFSLPDIYCFCIRVIFQKESLAHVKIKITKKQTNVIIKTKHKTFQTEGLPRHSILNNNNTLKAMK